MSADHNSPLPPLRLNRPILADHEHRINLTLGRLGNAEWMLHEVGERFKNYDAQIRRNHERIAALEAAFESLSTRENEETPPVAIPAG